MSTLRDKITMFLLVVLYLLFSVRYFPGRLAETLVETAIHIFSMAPMSIGATIFIVALFQKLSGQKMLKVKVARIFLLVAIALELIVSLSLYYDGKVGTIS